MKTDIDLIRKYNVSGPRYTSYPTAVQFRDIDRKDAVNGLYHETKGFYHELSQKRVSTGERAGGEGTYPRDLSLYFHIPFCFSLCWYCGCTKIITRDSDRGDHYIEYLEKEMKLILQQIDPSAKVVQIHFGGGTPTFLRPEQLLKLGEAIGSRFRLSPTVEYSVEIDPRRCTREHIEALREIGCNRASLGVQDTNPEVQEAIHRVQPFDVTSDVTNMLREVGIQDINFDLIYGLPRQTLATFRKTLNDVMQLNPDRLAVYSYAHLPHLMPAQKLLDETEFPPTETKLRMLKMATDLLPQQGMRFIGMDHFSKEEDSLSRALDDGTLQRNFQGYSTHAETDMIAFGMSGISQLENRYYQNTRNLGEYYGKLDEGELPVVKELVLTRDDKIRKDLIMQIMCRETIRYQDFSEKWGIDFEACFRDELNSLADLEADGLITRLPDRLHKTGKGRLFLRNIAMVFDAHLERSVIPGKERYSKTI